MLNLILLYFWNKTKFLNFVTNNTYILSKEEKDNGSFLGKIFKGYIAYKVISYPFRKNKYQDRHTYYDLQDDEDFYWEEE